MAVNTDDQGLALRGYDPVAYFIDGAPVEGSAAFTATHEGATYRFASAANRDAFVADPDAYLPQYGGFCAFGTAMGYKVDADPAAWRIVDGELYLNLNQKVQRRWNTDVPGYIEMADGKWDAIRDVPADELR